MISLLLSWEMPDQIEYELLKHFMTQDSTVVSVGLWRYLSVPNYKHPFKALVVLRNPIHQAVTRPRAGEAATERRVRAGLNRVTPCWRRVRGNDAATGHPVTI